MRHYRPLDTGRPKRHIRRMNELMFRRILFIAMVLAAPTILFLIQVVFIVPPVLLLAGAVRMVPKLITSGFDGENLTFLVLLLVGGVVLSGPYYLVAWLLGKVAGVLPFGWMRLALLGMLLAGLLWVTQQSIYGGGGHGPMHVGPLQDLLASLDNSYGRGTMLTVYLVALALSTYPVIASRRWRPRKPDPESA